MSNEAMKLTVGGPVQVHSGTYLPRPADAQLLAACQSGQFSYVLACRQIGKSSLMLETSKKLSQNGFRTAVIDLNAIGKQASDEEWYFSFLDELARRLELVIDVESWWNDRPHLSTMPKRFSQFLHDVVLVQTKEPVVVFIDEIDMTLGLNYTDDFFAVIRSVHNDRAQYPEYQRLTFVLLGVATPDELIHDNARTPFNIGRAIMLEDFTVAECEPFLIKLREKYPHHGSGYFEQLYEWTGGHPYLIQKLCAALLSKKAAQENSTNLVEKTVNDLFLAADARGEDNIQFVQNRVTKDVYAQEMLKIYQRILETDEGVPDNEHSPAINRLKLYGLVVVNNGQLAVRNKLYREAFDAAWSEKMLRLISTSVRLGVPERYKILQQIGEGGFATVYLAELDKDGNTQQVALKVLKAEKAGHSSQIVKRFKQEARTIQKLDHPNIVKILENFESNQISFISMEYVNGGTVRDRLKDGPLSRREAINIITQIGSALTVAHSKGIIHRDINPNNILLDNTQKPERPVLTDFGLTKVLIPDAGESRIQSTAIM
ncbi:MAG: AAA-like domain-containing protein, partial [Anaerolineae bacterium]|nr:AAA-like domain-containing protein [Anaerolineae bacterium]